ncbi:MAG: helix-turn-helix transcriptional regulator [Dinoroseobacter sp.]|nr:helix-turn-helix transcriptional regulator [Dinoroseobacter sp.]
MEKPFLAESFYKALDGQRQAKNLTWKKVAEQAKVSASTLTRIAQGKRPDVDTMAALCRWSGLNADDFVSRDGVKGEAEPLAQIMAHLRADKNISPEGAAAIETMIKSAYEQFRVE